MCVCVYVSFPQSFMSCVYSVAAFMQNNIITWRYKYITCVYVDVFTCSFWTYLFLFSSAKWRSCVRQDVPASSVLTITPSRSPVLPQHYTVCRTGCPTQTNLHRGVEDSTSGSAAVEWNIWNLETTSTILTDWTWATRRSRQSPMRRGDRYRKQTRLICREIVWQLWIVFSRRKTSRSGG